MTILSFISFIRLILASWYDDKEMKIYTLNFYALIAKKLSLMELPSNNNKFNNGFKHAKMMLTNVNISETCTIKQPDVSQRLMIFVSIVIWPQNLNYYSPADNIC